MSDSALYKHLPALAERVIDLSICNIEEGGLPFAALVVDQQGNIIGKGVNEVGKLFDCTAHAEVQAIREASLQQHATVLSGATMIASGEPCAFCYMAIRLAGMAKVVFISDRHEAAQHGFDYLWTYQYLNTGLLQALGAEAFDHAQKLLPFKLAKQQFAV